MKKYLILFLIMSVFMARPVLAGTLSCSVGLASACVSPAVIVYRISGSANAHNELPGQANYNSTVVCCSGVANLSSSCSTPGYTAATVLRLSGVTNAHAEEGGLSNSNYNGHDTCLSAPTGSTISVGYVNSGTCVGSGYDTTLGSLSGTTNAHVGDPSAYPLKICATVSGSYAASGTLTSSVFDTSATSSTIGYNSIMWKGALNGGNVRFQLAAEAASTGDINGHWNNFYGPDVSGGTNCSPSNWFTPSGPNIPVELNCPSIWNNKRFFRYKVQICSSPDCITPGFNTPTVDDIIVNWSP
jgi:hypothetical protein